MKEYQKDFHKFLFEIFDTKEKNPDHKLKERSFCKEFKPEQFLIEDRLKIKLFFFKKYQDEYSSLKINNSQFIGNGKNSRTPLNLINSKLNSKGIRVENIREYSNIAFFIEDFKQNELKIFGICYKILTDTGNKVDEIYIDPNEKNEKWETLKTYYEFIERNNKDELVEEFKLKNL